ncbi:hypothetical protein [Limnoraphis robusta]|uniref:Glycine zipper domain-containing protein n=1 Tax=Limnoraphis robusta CS-951 TaxID=1637645 RepID=A0A0F5YFU3_9CYAN|nr:hypothetical protein [Limnoraphis robusta]KKD37527.1 hypothetical protein WN50_13825 [Limnoraphis robusta CS-951]
MLKRLIVGLISVTLLFQSLVFSSPVYASPVITTENSQAVHKIPFSNSIEFYQELDKALKSNEPIVIKTDFKSYEEFPKDLKNIVKVDPSNSSIGTGGVIGALPGAHLALPAAGMGAATGLTLPLTEVTGADSLIAGAVGQLPNVMMPALLDEKALYLMICVTITGTGAGIGGLVGGPFGALVGGGLAGGACLIKDTVDKAFQSLDHSAEIKCGPYGCTITIKPTKPASSVA